MKDVDAALLDLNDKLANIPDTGPRDKCTVVTVNGLRRHEHDCSADRKRRALIRSIERLEYGE